MEKYANIESKKTSKRTIESELRLEKDGTSRLSKKQLKKVDLTDSILNDDEDDKDVN